MNKIMIKIIMVPALILALLAISHSTPQISIRTYLFFHGYPLQSIRTTVFPSRNDVQYGKQYSCKNPSIGFDFFSAKKILRIFWVVDVKNSGGG